MDAELLLINGNFHTMDPARPRASAVAIRGDRFVAVGDSEELREEFSGAGVIDLGGETVVPGFIDAHIHFLAYCLSLGEIDLVKHAEGRYLADE
nr:amidohydrolase family protein [Caldilineaceae bacterium]